MNYAQLNTASLPGFFGRSDRWLIWFQCGWSAPRLAGSYLAFLYCGRRMKPVRRLSNASPESTPLYGPVEMARSTIDLADFLDRLVLNALTA